MSKARPHAHIYEKWVRGIRAAVPDAEERCGLYEHIFAYQFAKVYGATELPRVQDLSSAAALAFAMLEGDLEELCEARKDNNSKRAQNGLQSIPSAPEQDLAGASRSLQDNTIQDNTIQDNSNTMQGRGALDEFAIGLALLRNGYIVRAAQLRGIYPKAAAARSPLAYAEKAGFNKCQDPTAGPPCASFVEATKCRDTRALEIYGVRVDDGILCVRCTAAAERAIGTTGTENAMQYAASIGATEIRYYSNAE